MKTWRETMRVFDEVARLHGAGRGAVLATLVRLEGSSYRRPGAKLLVRDDGSLLGNVSGGCLENDLRERALALLRAGGTAAVHYDTGEDESVVWGLGLGCNGRIDIFLQACGPRAQDGVIAEIRRRLDGNAPFVLRTEIDGPRAGAWSLHDAGPGQRTGFSGEEGARGFLDVLEPPADLVVVGAGDDAVPLVRIAVEAGFRVTVVDHRAAYLRADLFPGARRLVCARPDDAAPEIPSHARAFVVVKNHAIAHDKAWARRFAATEAPYIGLLGPKARRDDILASLAPAQRARAFGPIGLDLGAEGAEQIALSIVAEALALQAGRAGGHLRDRAAPIHG